MNLILKELAKFVLENIYFVKLRKKCVLVRKEENNTISSRTTLNRKFKDMQDIVSKCLRQLLKQNLLTGVHVYSLSFARIPWIESQALSRNAYIWECCLIQLVITQTKIANKRRKRWTTGYQNQIIWKPLSVVSAWQVKDHFAHDPQLIQNDLAKWVFFSVGIINFSEGRGKNVCDPQKIEDRYTS